MISKQVRSWFRLLFIAAGMATAVATPAQAQGSVTPAGTGTKSDPYQIRELGHLVWMGNNVASSSGMYYTVQNDIDATETTGWNAGAGFTPMGSNYFAQFNGIFDGNGKIIRNLAINRPAQEYVGLFGYLGASGVVVNIGLEGGSVQGLDYVGGLVGGNAGAISNCYSTGSVTGRDLAGGLVGANWSVMEGSRATGAISGRNYVGGLSGSSYFGTIERCYASGGITASGTGAGGLIGYGTSDIIENCYATGRVSGYGSVGGLLGQMENSMVAYTYAAGEVSGTINAGGLVGLIVHVTHLPDTTWIFASYWDLNATHQVSSAGGGTGATTAQMHKQATFPIWDFSAVWRITENVTYPSFRPPVFATVVVRANPTSAGYGGSALYKAGSSAQITATAMSGWNFSSWNDGDTSNPRTITVPASGATYTANYSPSLNAAIDLPTTVLTNGGSASWFGQTQVSHDGIAAAKSGVLSTGQQSSFQVTTNGPGSLLFWWKTSTATGNTLQFFIGTQLVNSISGNVNWTQYITYIGTSNPVTLKWVYTKNSATVFGSDAGFVDQVTWMPCPYAQNVPQLFFQEPSGTIASWVIGSTGSFQFARILANTGGWALKTAGDIDGDGVSDLLFQNSASDTGGWFLNADGSTRDARFWFNIGNWEIKAAGDYEGIGRAQLLFQNTAGTVAYWRLDTNGAFQSAVVLGNMPGWKLRGAGDLDGDHKADLFWQNTAGVVAIWYHDGPGGTIRGSIAFSTGEWALSGVIDVDNDGVCDLIWQTPDTRTGGWFMQTNGTARSASFWWPTGGWKLKAAGR